MKAVHQQLRYEHQQKDRRRLQEAAQVDAFTVAGPQDCEYRRGEQSE
jgi:hypothetical protein